MRNNLSMISALLVERANYERRGRHDRAALVTEQLRLLGHDEHDAPVEVAAVEPKVERAVKRRARKRDD